MAALVSWPLLNSCAISLRKTFSWLSRLFCNSFIRDIAIRNDVLLYNKQNFKVNNKGKLPKTGLGVFSFTPFIIIPLGTATCCPERDETGKSQLSCP